MVWRGGKGWPTTPENQRAEHFPPSPLGGPPPPEREPRERRNRGVGGRVVTLLFSIVLLVGCTEPEVEFASEESPTPTPDPKINGTCNLSIKNKCLEGKFLDSADTETHFQWICQGSPLGKNDFCKFHKPVNGACKQSFGF